MYLLKDLSVRSQFRNLQGIFQDIVPQMSPLLKSIFFKKYKKIARLFGIIRVFFIGRKLKIEPYLDNFGVYINSLHLVLSHCDAVMAVNDKIIIQDLINLYGRKNLS